MAGSYDRSIGVMGYQGGGDLHIKALEKLGLSCKKIYKKEDLIGVYGLILPGGESSVQSRFLERYDLENAIIQFAKSGKSILGTCAGCILLSQYQSNKVRGLGLLNINIERNIYGAQVASGKQVSDSGQEILFIRAPGILNVASNVKVLDYYNGTPIFVRQDNVYGATFHPEALNLNNNNILMQIFS